MLDLLACHHRRASHDTFAGTTCNIVVAKISFAKFSETRLDLFVATGQTTYAPAFAKGVTNVLEATADPPEGRSARKPLKRYDVP